MYTRPHGLGMRPLRSEYKYEFSIELETHPDQVGARDPRKVWCYDTQIGRCSVEQEWNSNWRTYYFESEADLLLFTLRWA